LKNRVVDHELDQAHLANAIYDARRDDPEVGYRLCVERSSCDCSAGNKMAVETPNSHYETAVAITG